MPPIDCAGDDLLIFMQEQEDNEDEDETVYEPQDDLNHTLVCDDLVDEQEPPTEMME